MARNFQPTVGISGRARAFGATIEQVTRRHKIKGRVVTFERAPRYVSFGVRLSDVTQLDKALGLGDKLAYASGTEVVMVQRSGGLLLYQFQLAQGYWKTYTRADLAGGPGIVGLGLSDGKAQVNFEFDPPHAGIFGSTGAGKSETVKSLLAGLFSAYTPDDLRAVVIDPDSDFAAFDNAAHLAMPIARGPGEIDRALAWASQEMGKRARAANREAGRLLVVVDEAERALADPRRMQAVQAIGKGGRKWNVNLLVASQDPDENTLPDLLPQVMNRYVGWVDKASTSYHLTGHKALACHKLSGKGDFMHVAGPEQQRLLVALATNADFDALPRAEVAPLEFDEEDPLDPDRLEDDAGAGWWDGDGGGAGGRGRPANEIEPALLARYLLAEGRVKRSVALVEFGLTDYAHRQYKAFARQTIEEIKRLMAAGKARVGV